MARTIEVKFTGAKRWGFHAFVLMAKLKWKWALLRMAQWNPPMVTWRIEGGRPNTLRFRDLHITLA